MEAVAATAAPADDALAARTRTGDREAFIALYEPHFGGVFDFVLRVVRDRDEATAVVRRAIAKAWNLFPERGAPPALLYVLARSCASEELRQHRRRNSALRTDREGLDFTQIDADRLSNRSAVLFDREFVELVWDSAAALSVEEYSLLDLHVRRELGAEELAEHLSSESDSVQTRLARLRESFDEAVISTLLATRCRRNCHQLDVLLAELDVDGITPKVRMAIQQHVRRCDRCQESKRGFVSPTEVLGSFALMSFDPGVRVSAWKSIPAA